MPIDINFLRVDRGGDPDFWRENQRKRFCDPGLVDVVLALDEQWRVITTTLRDSRKLYNIGNREVATLKKAGQDASAKIAELVALDTRLNELEAQLKQLEADREANLNKIANILDPSVPVSKDEADNAVVYKHGELRREEGLYHHHELLWMIDGYEPERGSAIAGHRGYFLKGPGVQLNLALINYGIAFLMARKYTPLQTPFFMNKEVMAGVAQLSEFDEALYAVHAGDGEKKYLIATSEQPICAYHKDEELNEKKLPIRYGGFSTCFRKEAGSAGRDAWGIFRVHQFEKVEQFCITTPEESAAMQEEMIGIAMDFYKSLNLSFHVVNIVSGELNNAAAKKYDLEAWFPTLQTYRELVSCSNCTDYQSRAMEIRCGAKKMDEKLKKYVHMLNATLCATTRTICCILENYQTKTGITVPAVLVPFMGGLTEIPFTRDPPSNFAKLRAEAGAAKKAAAAAAAAGGDAPATAEAPAAKPAVAPKPAKAAAAPKEAKPTAAKVAAKPAAAAPTTAAAAAGAPAAPVGSLAQLNDKLLLQSYVAGFAPSKADNVEFKKLGDAPVDAAAYPNVARWQRNIASFTAAQRAAFP